MGNDDRNSGNDPDYDEYDDDGTDLLGADLVDAIDAAIGQRSSGSPSLPELLELDALQIEPLDEPRRHANEPRRPQPPQPQGARETAASSLRARLAAARGSVPPPRAEPPPRPPTRQEPRPPMDGATSVVTPAEIDAQLAARQVQKKRQPPEPEPEATAKVDRAAVAETFRQREAEAATSQVERSDLRHIAEGPAPTDYSQPADDDYTHDEEATDLVYADEVARVVQRMATERGVPTANSGPSYVTLDDGQRVDRALERLQGMKAGRKEGSKELDELRSRQIRAAIGQPTWASADVTDDDYSEDATGIAFAEEVVKVVGAAPPSRFSPADTTFDQLDDALGHLARIRDGSDGVHQLRESQYESLAREPSVAEDEYGEQDMSTAFAEEVAHAAAERARERGRPIAPAAPLNQEQRVDNALMQLEMLTDARKPKNDKLDRLRQAQINAALGSSWEGVRAGVDQGRLEDVVPEPPWRARSALSWAVGLSLLAGGLTLWIVSLMWWPAVAAISVYALLWGVPASVVAFRSHQTRLRRATLSITVYVLFSGLVLAWSLPEVRIAALQLTGSVMSPQHFLRVLHDPSERVVIAACADAASNLDMASVLRTRAAKSPMSALRCATQIGDEEEKARVIDLLSTGWAEQIRAAGRCEGLEEHIKAFLASRGIENAAGARAVIELTLRADSEEVASCLANAIPSDDSSLTARLGDPGTATSNDAAIFAGLVEEAFLDNPVAAAIGATTLEAQIWTLRLGCQLLLSDPTDFRTVDSLNGIASALDGETDVAVDERTWLGWCAEFSASLTLEDLRRKVRHDQVRTAVGAAQTIVHAALNREDRNNLYEDMELGAAQISKYETEGNMFESPAGAPRVMMDGGTDVMMMLAGGQEQEKELAPSLGQDDEQFCNTARMRSVFSSAAMPGALGEAFGDDNPEAAEDIENGAGADDPEADAEYRKSVAKRCGEDFYEREIEFPGIEPGTEWTGPGD